MEQIAQEPRDDVLGPDAVPEALARADIVIILVPLNPRHLRHRRRVLPGPDAVIDTAALLAELTSGRLRAALDVTDSGPLPAGHPLWSRLAPHPARRQRQHPVHRTSWPRSAAS